MGWSLEGPLELFGYPLLSSNMAKELRWRIHCPWLVRGIPSLVFQDSPNMGHLLGSTTGKMCSFLGFQRQANQTLWRLQISWLSYLNPALSMCLSTYPWPGCSVVSPAVAKALWRGSWSQNCSSEMVLTGVINQKRSLGGKGHLSDDSYKSIRGMSHFQTLSDLSMLQWFKKTAHFSWLVIFCFFCLTVPSMECPPVLDEAIDTGLPI